MSLFNQDWPFGDLPAQQAKCILADPPWYFTNYSAKGEKKNPNQHYDCMTVDQIAALPVGELADPNGCALTMWCTWPFLKAGIDVLEEWGFTLKTGGSWAKMTKHGKQAIGPGYIYRASSEFWLVGTIGDPKRQSRSIRNSIIATTREHSRKPDQMHDDLEKLWPGPRIELFARESRPGWSTWGNQAEKFDRVASPDVSLQDSDRIGV